MHLSLLVDKYIIVIINNIPLNASKTTHLEKLNALRGLICKKVLVGNVVRSVGVVHRLVCKFR